MGRPHSRKECDGCVFSSPIGTQNTSLVEVVHWSSGNILQLKVRYFFQSNDSQSAISLGISYRRAQPGEIFVNGLEATKIFPLTDRYFEIWTKKLQPENHELAIRFHFQLANNNVKPGTSYNLPQSISLLTQKKCHHSTRHQNR